MNTIDQMNIAKSIRYLMLSQSSTADQELEKIADMILKAEYRERTKQHEPLPPYLQNFCRICGTYQNIVTTPNGLICVRCESSIGIERKEEPSKIRVFLLVKNANGDVIQKLGQLAGPDIAAITKPYSDIAKKNGYIYWRTDPSQSLVGGHYYKNSGEKIILSRDDVAIKTGKPVRPTLKEKA